MEVPNADTSTAIERKPPRKPRPSEIAAKKAKAAAKRKPAPKKAAKPKAKKPVKAKRPKAKKAVKRKPAPKKKKAKNARPLVRVERVELRLSKGERAKLNRHAKATDRTVTSVLVGMIAKLK